MAIHQSTLPLGRGSVAALALAIMLSGCGSAAPAPAVPPVAAGGSPVSPTDPAGPGPVATAFAAVTERMERFPVRDVALIVGDGRGVRFRYQRGTMTPQTPVFIASASKMLLGTTAWLLVEDGVFAPKTAVNTLIDFWSRDPADARSGVTVEQLFAFTSGFNGTAEQDGCIGSLGYSLQRCVREIHDGGPDTLPGLVFSYGNEHMQIAALAMVTARGRSIDAMMRERLFDRLRVSAETRYTYGAGDNPTYSGGMRSTGEDYGLVLAAIVRGDIFANRAGFLEDRMQSRPAAALPPAITRNRLAWRYGWGFWKECAGPTYAATCDAAPVISSAGAFGFTPWIDFGRGYWGVIVLEEPLNRGYDPAEVAIALELELQPLISAALTR